VEKKCSFGGKNALLVQKKKVQYDSYGIEVIFWVVVIRERLYVGEGAYVFINVMGQDDW